MIHLVFQHNDIDRLKEAMELDSSLLGEVIQIEDDYAVGPIKDIFLQDGIAKRKQWWREVLAGGDYNGLVDIGGSDDLKIIENIIDKLRNNADEVIWIWAAQNKHDVSGYYLLISQLNEFHGRIFILYLNNLPFINEKGGIFYPMNLFQIPAKEFLKAKKLARPVTLSEFEIDPDEWNRLTAEDKGVRILEGGKKLVQFDYDFYDEDLKKFITGDWQKASRIIHNFLHRNTHITGDAFLLWRLKLILSNEEYDVQGELKAMKDFEIKRKVIQPEITVQATE